MVPRHLDVVIGLGLIGLILWDGFDFALLAALPTGRRRWSRAMRHWIWTFGRALATRSGGRPPREGLLEVLGPLSMIAIFATWALGLVLGFGLLQWGLEAHLHDAFNPPGRFDYFYFSGVTFFTLGYGDIVPLSVAGRLIALVEVGTGFSFLALIIGYFPVLTQAYAAREVEVLKLGVRAGTPPTAAGLVLRLGPEGGLATLTRSFEQWEAWAATVRQSHSAYPILAFYRSQSPKYSWLAAMTVMLDTSALFLTVVVTPDRHPAQALFTMVRSFLADLADMIRMSEPRPQDDRLPPGQLDALIVRLKDSGFPVDDTPEARQRFENLRATYEPLLDTLARHLLVRLPSLSTDEGGGHPAS